MGGRPRKPTALKLLEGTYRKDRAYNEPQPKKVSIDELVVPSHVDEEIKELWLKYGKELTELGLLTNVDAIAFEVLLKTYHQLSEVEAAIKEDGMYVTDDRGNTRRNPLLSQANQLRQTLRQYLSDFGMTPSSRSKINAPEQEKEPTELEKMFGDV